MKSAIGIAGVMFVLFCLTFWVPSAYAKGGGGPPPCMPWDRPCDDSGDEAGNTNVTVETNVKNYNTNLNTNLNHNEAQAYGGQGGAGGQGGKGGKGGNADANANADADASINIGNGMFNKNFSPEANQAQGQDQDQIQGQMQGQDQDQKQGQGQSQNQDASNKQGQSQDASNKQGQAQETTVTITDNTVVEDNRELLAAPTLPQADAKIATDLEPFGAKTLGFEIFDTTAYVVYEDAMHVAKDCDDYEIERAAMAGGHYTENGIINLDVAIGADNGAFKGYLILHSTGDDVSAPGCMGRIVQKAMKEGYNQYRLVLAGFGQAAVGDSTNLSLGAGTSVLSHGQSIGTSGTGGLGWSTAEAWTEYRPEIVIEVYVK